MRPTSIDRPLLTAITPISLDHQQLLGDTLGQIAGEKAGILKPGVPAVIGAAGARGAAVIEAPRRRAIGAPLVRQRQRMAGSAAARPASRCATASDRLDLPLPALPGAHQIDNAGARAIAALAPRAPLAPAHARDRRGLRRRRLAGAAAAADARPAGRRACRPAGELWLDGGHNPAAGRRAGAEPAGAWPPAGRCISIVGMLNTKDAVRFLAAARPLVSSADGGARPRRAAEPRSGRDRPAARGLDLDASAAPTVESALSRHPPGAADAGPGADLRLALSRGQRPEGERLSQG